MGHKKQVGLFAKMPTQAVTMKDHRGVEFLWSINVFRRVFFFFFQFSSVRYILISEEISRGARVSFTDEYLIASKNYLARFPRIPFVRNQNSIFKKSYLVEICNNWDIICNLNFWKRFDKGKLTAAFFVFPWNRIRRIKWMLCVLPESFKRRQNPSHSL